LTFRRETPVSLVLQVTKFLMLFVSSGFSESSHYPSSWRPGRILQGNLCRGECVGRLEALSGFIRKAASKARTRPHGGSYQVSRLSAYMVRRLSSRGRYCTYRHCMYSLIYCVLVIFDKILSVLTKTNMELITSFCQVVTCVCI